MGSVPGSPQASSFIGPIGSRVSSFLHALQSPVMGYRAKRDEEGGVGADALGLLCGQQQRLPAPSAPADAVPCSKTQIEVAAGALSGCSPLVPDDAANNGNVQALAVLTAASPAAPILALLRITPLQGNLHVSAPRYVSSQRRRLKGSSIGPAFWLPRSLRRWMPCTSLVSHCRLDQGQRHRRGSGSNDISENGTSGPEYSRSISGQGTGGLLSLLEGNEDLGEQMDGDTSTDIEDEAHGDNPDVQCVGATALCGLDYCLPRRWRNSRAAVTGSGAGVRCCAWTVASVSAAPLAGCSCPEEYAEVLRRLMASELGLRRAVCSAARAAIAGKLFEATVLLSSSGAGAFGGEQPHTAGSWRGLPYIQVQSCLLPAAAGYNLQSDENLAHPPFDPEAVTPGFCGGDGRAFGLRIVHCSAPLQSVAAAATAAAAGVPLSGDASLAITMAAVEQQAKLSVKALAADMAQGLITVIDYTSGAILYQNRNSQAYMGEAPPVEVMIAVEAREQQLLLHHHQLQQQQRMSLHSQSSRALTTDGAIIVSGDPGPGLFRVPLVLRELLRHEPGALERLQACLKAGEEFEETVQVPATLSPFLASLRPPLETAACSGADPSLAPPAAVASATDNAEEARRLVSVIQGKPSTDGPTDAPPISPRTQKAAAWFLSNGSSGRFRIQHHNPQQQQQQQHSQATPQGRRAAGGVCNGNSGAGALLSAPGAPACSLPGFASRICSGTSRLGRMTRPEDLPSGSGVQPFAHAHGLPSAWSAGAPSPLPLRGGDLDAESSPDIDGNALRAAGEPSQMLSTEVNPDPVSRMAATTSPNVSSRTLLACSLQMSAPAAIDPLRLAGPSVTPLPMQPALAGAGTAYAPGVSADAVMSGGSGSSPREAGPSSLTNLARRMTRLLGRANTFGVGSAGSQRSGGSGTAALSGNTSPLLGFSAFRTFRTQCSKAASGTPLPAPLPVDAGLSPHYDGVALGLDETEEPEHEADEVTPDGRFSERSTPPKAPWSIATTAVARESGGALPATTSDALLWTLGRMRGSRDQRRQSQQLPSPPAPALQPAPPTHRQTAVTGRASTGSCNLSRATLNFHLNERRAAAAAAAAARSRIGKRWSMGASPRLSAYESAPAAAGAALPAGVQMATAARTFAGFTRTGALGVTASQAAIAFGFGVSSPVGSLPVPGTLPLPTPSQRRYGASSPRAPPQGILVPSRRPAPIPGVPSAVAPSTFIGACNSGFSSGLVGGGNVLDGSVGAVVSVANPRFTGARGETGTGAPASGELQVVGRTNSILQAIMSLPDRSHFFTRRRQASAARAFCGGNGVSATFSRCSLDLRMGSTGGNCLPGVGVGGMATSAIPATINNSIGGGGAGMFVQRTSAGASTYRTIGSEALVEGDSIRSLNGAVVGGGAGAVTGDMSDLEASPYALRIDSVTALKATRTRRPPPRRASSQSSLLRLRNAATAAAASLCTVERTGTSPPNNAKPEGLPPDGCSITKMQPAATVDSASMACAIPDTATVAAATPAILSEGVNLAEPAARLDEVARWRGSTGSIPSAPSPYPDATSPGGEVGTATSALTATGDNAIEAAIAAAIMRSPKTSTCDEVEGIDMKLAVPSHLPLFPAAPKANERLRTASQESTAACGIQGYNDSVNDAPDVGKTTVGGESEAQVEAEVEASGYCDATIQGLLVGLRALKDDVQSLHSDTQSTKILRNITVGSGVGAGDVSTETSAADGDISPWMASAVKADGSGKKSASAMAVLISASATPSASFPRLASRSGTPTSLLSLKLKNYGSSSSAGAGNCGLGGGGGGCGGGSLTSGIRRLAENLVSPFSSDAAIISAAAATAMPNSADEKYPVEGPSGFNKLVSTPYTSFCLDTFLPPPPHALEIMRDSFETCTHAITAQSTPDATILMAADSEEGPKTKLCDHHYHHHEFAHRGGDTVIISTGADGDEFPGLEPPVGTVTAAGAWLGNASDGAVGMPSATSIVAAAAAALIDVGSKPRRTSTRTRGGASAGGSLSFLNPKASPSGPIRIKDDTAAATAGNSPSCDSGRSSCSGMARSSPPGNHRGSPSSSGGAAAMEGRRSILDTLSLEMTRLGATGKSPLAETDRDKDGFRIGADIIMKSGSYTAGAPTPATKGHPPPAPRRQYNRQSTHDRIEQLLEIARNTVSTCEQPLDSAAAGGGGCPGCSAAGVNVSGPCNGPGGAGCGGAGAGVFGPLWHSVHVCVCNNPVTGVPVLVVTQHDVTQQMDARSQLTMLLQREQKILESIFPRHVIEYLTTQHPFADAGSRLGRVSAGGRLPLRTSGGDSSHPQQSSLFSPSPLLQQQPQQSQLQQQAGSATGAVGNSSTTTTTTPTTNNNGGLLAHYRSSAAQLACVATAHPCVTILFADIVGFTSMSKQVTPLEVMTFLNQLYSRFDAMLDIYKVYKVETIGDCFMVAGGLVAQDEEGWRTTITHDRLHAVRVLAFAKAMLREARKVQMPTGGPVLMRVGIHSGPVMSGVVGSRMPRFCLFGDTVNTASRMESTSRPGRIHVSADTHALLPNERWEPTGGVQVKGKGVMPTYLWASDVAEEKGEQLHRVLGVYL